MSLLLLASSPLIGHQIAAPVADTTFYRDVLPILQEHCQVCHRGGGIAPMPFENYEGTRPYSAAIRAAVQNRSMPPWFAERGIGKFSNDLSLTEEQIALFAAWAEANSPAGNPTDAPPKKKWADRWTIPAPDLEIKMAEPVNIPADGDVDYTYEILPTHFTPEDKKDAMWTDSDILLVYAPGSTPDNWPRGMAKFIPAGSDLVFQMHYTTNGRPGKDFTRIGLIFAKEPPEKRVLTLQLTNDHFVIPPGVPDYRVEARGTLPNDALLLSFFPHMHLRGKRFEYNIIHKDKSVEPLLRVHYHFHWQMSYRLAEPLQLMAGTQLQGVAWFDNSKGNPHNPDPGAAVRWGEQTYDEMMVGFFDVAVDSRFDKPRFFQRGVPSASEK